MIDLLQSKWVRGQMYFWCPNIPGRRLILVYVTQSHFWGPWFIQGPYFVGLKLMLKYNNYYNCQQLLTCEMLEQMVAVWKNIDKIVLWWRSIIFVINSVQTIYIRRERCLHHNNANTQWLVYPPPSFLSVGIQECISGHSSKTLYVSDKWAQFNLTIL